MSRLACAALLAISGISSAFAGGMLSNTNQSISFLRNPARDAAIGVDGVYSNPAGVAFMEQGFHFGLNWQCAVQTRTIDTTSPYLDHTLQATELNAPTKRYRGHASASFVPSLNAAYNTGKWSFQFNFAIAGGGGKCEFTKGLGSFESMVGQIASMMKALDAKGYSVDNYLEGRQYYFGITLGTAYKVTDNLSVYGGLRALIANTKYIAQIKDIQVATSDGLLNLSDFINYKRSEFSALTASLNETEAYVNGVIAQTKPYYDQYASQYDNIKAAAEAGSATHQQLLTALDAYKAAVAGQAQIEAGREKIAAGEAGLDSLTPYANGIDLECDQSGFGIAPIVGIDYKLGNLNLAAKYEFRTKMSLHNSSNLSSASVAATAQFVDGQTVREDTPALLALGAQYTIADIVRLNAGYHHFYDKQAKKFANKQDLLSGGTNEYLAGVEVDLTDRLTVSLGGQVTRYGLTDEYMSDMSFVTNSKSFGFGAKYKANEWVTIQAAYFTTFYEDYTTANGMNKFTRTNDVIGVGCDIDF